MLQYVCRGHEWCGCRQGGKVYIDPVKKECSAFAPATVANLGPGFDWMGCAVEVRYWYGMWRMGHGHTAPCERSCKPRVHGSLLVAIH